MDKMELKIVGAVLVAVAVLNLVLFALRKISPLVFWMVIIIMAVIAWKVVPKIQKP